MTYKDFDSDKGLELLYLIKKQIIWKIISIQFYYIRKSCDESFVEAKNIVSDLN